MAYNMSPDPLSANWSYDSAIDLFSLNTMMPESFPMDIPNDLFLESKDLPSDFWAAPTDINGFTVSHDDSLSSEDSDDQSYSPTNFMSSTPPASADFTISSPIALPQAAAQSAASKRNAASISTRYSSSPELHPQQQPSTTPTTTQTTTTSSSTSAGRKSRNNSDDSTRGRNAAKRAAHNIIEKRYRTNMNAKFVALEKAMAVKPSGGVSKPTSTSVSGVKASASLKKSEILSNAIAYMQELQEANDRLRKEVATLNRRVSYC